VKESLLPSLRCPACAEPLRLVISRKDGDEVTRGTLACGGCGAVFPIQDGIPTLIPGPLPEQEERTSAAFGAQWLHFSELYDETREQFLDWVAPLGPEDFRGRRVLDAGCGMGRLSYVAAGFGTAELVAVDLSAAVQAAGRNLRGLPNVHVVRADILSLPFRKPFDLVYSIGVLHHLPDPAAGFRHLLPHVRPGGKVVVWVYAREGNEWLVRFLNPIRQRITARLPMGARRALSFAIDLILHPVLKLFYRWDWPGRRLLPYRAYLSWLARYGFRHNQQVIFDHLSAPTAFYIPRADFESWFRDAGLRDVTITCRNGNSWRGMGTKPEKGSGAFSAAERVPDPFSQRGM